MSLPAHKPDTLENIVRFVCGAVAGALLALCASPDSVTGGVKLFAVVAGAALMLGLLAMWFGDSFWRWLLCLFHPW